jgi:hypothetical protein
MGGMKNAEKSKGSHGPSQNTFLACGILKQKGRCLMHRPFRESSLMFRKKLAE